MSKLSLEYPQGVGFVNRSSHSGFQAKDDGTLEFASPNSGSFIRIGGPKGNCHVHQFGHIILDAITQDIMLRVGKMGLSIFPSGKDPNDPFPVTLKHIMIQPEDTAENAVYGRPQQQQVESETIDREIEPDIETGYMAASVRVVGEEQRLGDGGTYFEHPFYEQPILVPSPTGEEPVVRYLQVGYQSIFEREQNEQDEVFLAYARVYNRLHEEAGLV